MVENKINKMDFKNVLLMKNGDMSGLCICFRNDLNWKLIFYFVYCFIFMGFMFSFFVILFWKGNDLEKLM